MGFVLTRKEKEGGNESNCPVIVSPPFDLSSGQRGLPLRHRHAWERRGGQIQTRFAYIKSDALHEVAATCSVRPRQSKGTDTVRAPLMGNDGWGRQRGAGMTDKTWASNEKEGLGQENSGWS